jgi:hypothetical protein
MELAALVMARLHQHGWAADRIIRTVAVKEYPTAVGLKQGSVRLVQDHEVPQYWLKGEYLSEGRNALAGCFAIIPADADSAAVQSHVDAFAAEVNRQVAGTYAARLLS